MGRLLVARLSDLVTALSFVAFFCWVRLAHGLCYV